MRHTISALAVAMATLCVPTGWANSDEIKHAPEPQKVYVENADGSYRSTSGEEHCFYHEAHDHIHCYDEDPNTQSSYDQSRQSYSNRSSVVVEESRTYRQTRHQPHRSNPIATGIGVGLAIGIPLLVHDSLRDHRRYRHYSHRSYHRYARNHRYDKNHYGSYSSGRNHHNKHRNKYRRQARAYLY